VEETGIHFIMCFSIVLNAVNVHRVCHTSGYSRQNMLSHFPRLEIGRVATGIRHKKYLGLHGWAYSGSHRSVWLLLVGHTVRGMREKISN